MRTLRILVLSLITALFAVSGMARAMPAAPATPPCHEAPTHHGKSAPVPAMMTCCIGCMPAPVEATVVLTSLPAQRPAYAPVQVRITGRLTAPDPDPPRLRV
jgi:hypothetical protein